MAAEVKKDTERKLWQAVFGLLAVFGLVVSFLVEIQLDKDHTKEMTDLRGGIKDDIFGVILDYNKAHPQQQITSEQSRQIINSVTDQRPPSGMTSRTGPASRDSTTRNPYELLSDSELIAVSKVAAKQIDDVMGAWKWQIESEIEPRRNEQVYYRDPAPEEDERNRLNADYDKQVEAANRTYGSQAKELFVRAEALREVLVNRLGQKNSMPLPSDSKFNDLFKGLAVTVPASYRGDSSKMSAHLLELCKRLEQASG